MVLRMRTVELKIEVHALAVVPAAALGQEFLEIREVLEVGEAWGESSLAVNVGRLVAMEWEPRR